LNDDKYNNIFGFIFMNIIDNKIYRLIKLDYIHYIKKNLYF